MVSSGLRPRLSTPAAPPPPWVFWVAPVRPSPPQSGSTARGFPLGSGSFFFGVNRSTLKAFGHRGQAGGHRVQAASICSASTFDIPATRVGITSTLRVASRSTWRAVGHQVQAAHICIASIFGMPNARVLSTSTLRIASRSTWKAFGHRVQAARFCSEDIGRGHTGGGFGEQ